MKIGMVSGRLFQVLDESSTVLRLYTVFLRDRRPRHKSKATPQVESHTETVLSGVANILATISYRGMGVTKNVQFVSLSLVICHNMSRQ